MGNHAQTFEDHRRIACNKALTDIFMSSTPSLTVTFNSLLLKLPFYFVFIIVKCRKGRKAVSFRRPSTNINYGTK